MSIQTTAKDQFPGRWPVLPIPAGIVANFMTPSLRQQAWTIRSGDRQRQCHVFLVTRGAAVWHLGGGADIELKAPAILWLPETARGAFALSAGSNGIMATIAADLVWRAVGESPLAQNLLSLTERTAAGLADRILPYLPELSTIMNTFLRETRDQLPGGPAMLELNLELMLLHLWRISGAAAVPGQKGTGGTTVQAFRQLVEIHYRENLAIDDFAALLGVSRAHLHEACLKATGRTPLAIIHERQIEEAKARLEQTRLSIEQIGYGLGFRDPGYFSRFFKRLTGQPPGTYRRRMAKTHVTEAPSFAAWP